MLVKLITFFTNPKLSLKKVLVFEFTYLWKFLSEKSTLSMKCPVFYLWIYFSMKSPVFKISYQWFCYIWNVHLRNDLTPNKDPVLMGLVYTLMQMDPVSVNACFFSYLILLPFFHFFLLTFFYFSETLFSDLNAQFFLFYFCFIWYSFTWIQIPRCLTDPRSFNHCV